MTVYKPEFIRKYISMSFLILDTIKSLAADANFFKEEELAGVSCLSLMTLKKKGKR